MFVYELSDIFSGEFRTKRRIFTTIDGVIHVYPVGSIKDMKRANLKEDISSGVSGLE